MLKKVVARVYLAALALAMVAAAVTAFAPSTTLANEPGGGESGTCCTTSADCPGTSLCYVPSNGLAPCSQGQANYCR
jgi:hypothetical protein